MTALQLSLISCPQKAFIPPIDPNMLLHGESTYWTAPVNTALITAVNQLSWWPRNNKTVLRILNPLVYTEILITLLYFSESIPAETIRCEAHPLFFLLNDTSCFLCCFEIDRLCWLRPDAGTSGLRAGLNLLELTDRIWKTAGNFVECLQLASETNDRNLLFFVIVSFPGRKVTPGNNRH